MSEATAARVGAILLAGGRASRMGGVVKPLLEVGGRSLLRRAIDAVQGCDPVTVAAELDRRGLLRRIGGAPYLHTLISTVPTAANAGYYAGIVAEKALLRRLVEAGTRVVQYGYAGAEGADVA